MRTFLKKAQQHGELRLFDLQFARHMIEVNGKEVSELLLAAALASNRISHGDTCLALDTVASSPLYKNPELRTVRQKLLPVDKWRSVLLEQKVVSLAPVIKNQPGQLVDDEPVSSNNSDASVDTDGTGSEIEPDHANTSMRRSRQLSPLVLDERNRLYLARYWVLEQSLTRSVNRLLDRESPVVDSEKLKLALNKLFVAGDTPD